MTRGFIGVAASRGSSERYRNRTAPPRASDGDWYGLRARPTASGSWPGCGRGRRTCPGSAAATAWPWALDTGCGLTRGGLVRVRGCHPRVLSSEAVVVGPAVVGGRRIVCRASREGVLAELGEAAGEGYLFRPNRTVAASKNLVSDWVGQGQAPRRAAPAGCPPVALDLDRGAA